MTRDTDAMETPALRATSLMLATEPSRAIPFMTLCSHVNVSPLGVNVFLMTLRGDRAPWPIALFASRF
jgi:hypothetical protein